MKVKTFTDGGARGNPGPAGIGGVVFDTQGNVLAEVSEYIGETTNNQAEYRALLVTLHAAAGVGASEVDCYMDSELVVKQMRREYRVKDPGLAALYVQIHNATMAFKKVHFFHVPREHNKHADRLVNKAIDAAVARNR